MKQTVSQPHSINKNKQAFRLFNAQKQKTRAAKDNGDFSTPPQFLRCLPKGIKPSRKLNPSQMDALDSAAANTLTLIQGPPGAKKNIDLKILLRDRSV